MELGRLEIMLASGERVQACLHRERNLAVDREALSCAISRNRGPPPRQRARSRSMIPEETCVLTRIHGGSWRRNC